MKWYSVLAVYLLFWVVALFVVLPYGVRTPDELGHEKVPGQADSAPGNVSMARKFFWTTLISAIAFFLFYMNWQMGWITRADLENLLPAAIRG